MDIGDNRHVAIALAQALDDILKIARVLYRRRGDANDFAARFRQLDCLLDRRFRVHRVARDHRLDTDRVRTADADIAYLYSFASTVLQLGQKFTFYACGAESHF